MKRTKRLAVMLAILAAPLLAQAPGASARTPAVRRAAPTGTLTGVITDAVTKKPLAHTLVTVGYLTPGYQRAGETDAHGRYTITGLPATKRIDSYGFAQGHFYYHGATGIRAGGTTVYSYAMAPDTTSLKHPRILSYYGRPTKGGAQFGFTAVPGDGPFSFEMLAISPALGRLVVLGHGPGIHYDGTLKTPAGVKPGLYRFYYVATMESCLENRTFPYKDVRLG